MSSAINVWLYAAESRCRRGLTHNADGSAALFMVGLVAFVLLALIVLDGFGLSLAPSDLFVVSSSAGLL